MSNNLGYLTDLRDMVIFETTPTLLQPKYGSKLPEPPLGTHRFVCGSAGLYIEAKNEVLSVRLPIAVSSLKLPYGDVVHTGIHLDFGLIPRFILDLAIAKAKIATPNEWAGYIVWVVQENRYTLFEPDVMSASLSRISYSTAIPSGLIPVMDLHSHGRSSAFFSGTDNVSDLGGFYVAGVIGNCDLAEQTFAARMVVNGHFLPCPALSVFFC